MDGKPVSQHPMTRCFQWVTDTEIMQAMEYSRKARTRSTTSGLALCCWKMAFGRPRRYGSTPRPSQPIALDACPLCRHRMQACDKWSPWNLQALYTVIRILDAKPIPVLKDDIPSLSFLAPVAVSLSLSDVLSREVESRSRKECCKHRHTVRADTGHAGNMPIS
ncbi:hypothetical protein TNCV_4974501 [Trichonephila clavipes]|uniref:Uncharacterized protein n=1 Tax=Trichonephila clavipes TaxID=2585209 RepID=A0A8X6SIC1_TRICX|nr:hypothetical protein TNCV_4974501 [Trichonephila clavipes]